jgi:hypothetical protein
MKRHGQVVLSGVLAAACIALTFGHSSLLIPPSRNAVDRVLPPWRGGSHGDGTFGPDAWGCNCINATTSLGQVPCDVGQSCFWFSNGCSIGCPTCDGGAGSHGGANPNTQDRCGSGAKATINDPKLRTFNRDAEAGSAADICTSRHFSTMPCHAIGLPRLPSSLRSGRSSSMRTSWSDVTTIAIYNRTPYCPMHPPSHHPSPTPPLTHSPSTHCM